MLRSVVVLLAFALGVLPAVHDMCGPECEMSEVRAVVGAAPDEADGECPLHPADDQTPAHETDGCTHDHGTVQEAPESPSALAPSVPHSVDLPITAFSRTMPVVTAHPRGHAVVSPPVERSPQLLPLRI